MSNRIPKFLTDSVEVVFSNLHRPDVMFGEASANHNVTVLITPELQAKIEEIKAETGVTKVNGLGNDKESGAPTIKLKSNLHCRDESGNPDLTAVFPHVGPDAKPTDMTAARGDLVRIKVGPKVLTKPTKAISLYLDAIQIVEKNSEYGNGGSAAADFEPVTTTVPDDDIPF